MRAPGSCSGFDEDGLRRYGHRRALIRRELDVAAALRAKAATDAARLMEVAPALARSPPCRRPARRSAGRRHQSSRSALTPSANSMMSACVVARGRRPSGRAARGSRARGFSLRLGLATGWAGCGRRTDRARWRRDRSASSDERWRCRAAGWRTVEPKALGRIASRSNGPTMADQLRIARRRR